ncbi:MAG: hypothetical protein ACYDA3_01475 [Gaiellaceae bacterium]
MVRLVGVLAAVAALFVAGIAVSAFGARADAPLKSQTYTDPAGDQTGGGPDITGVVVDNRADGTIDVSVALPREPALVSGEAVVVWIDTDSNATTGQNGFDALLTADGAYPSATSIELLKWLGTPPKWTLVGRAPTSVNGAFTPQVGVDFSVAKDTLGVGSGFRFYVRAADRSGDNALHGDDAPSGGGTFTYALGTPPSTTTATTPTTMTTTPKPKPVPRCKTGRHNTKKKPCRR